jgi:hypothetical protein
MRISRVSSLAFFTLLGAACSAPPNDSIDEPIASQAQAVWTLGPDGGPQLSNDVGTKATNVVVRIPHLLNRTGATGGDEDPSDTGCVGVFLTPTVVLTSKYCISASKGGPSPVVQVGASTAEFVRWGSSRAAIAAPASFIAGIDSGDLALVFVTPPSAAEAARIEAQHPTFAPPAPSAEDPATHLRTFAKIELTGWSPFAFTNAEDPPVVVDGYAQTRQSAPIASAPLWWLSNTDLGSSGSPAGRYFFVRPFMQGYNAATAKVGLHAGDFGSPLFAYASATSTTRQLVGLATTSGASLEQRTVATIPGTDCSDGRCDVWIDLTRPAVVQWLEANAADKSHDAQPNWNRSHPRADGRVRTGNIPDWWLGESDGNGGCGASDTDCDGWNQTNADAAHTARDNCPAIANPDQKDTDDDGLGDRCDSSPNVRVAITNAQQSVDGESAFAEGRYSMIKDLAFDVRCSPEGATKAAQIRSLAGEIQSAAVRARQAYDAARVLPGLSAAESAALSAIQTSVTAIETKQTKAFAYANAADQRAAQNNVRFYRVGRGPQCGVDLYNLRQDEAICGFHYNTATDGNICGWTYPTYEATSATFCRAGGVTRHPTCNSGDTLKWESENVIGYCFRNIERVEMLGECNSVANRTPNTCTSPSFGKVVHWCRDARFGVERYNECRHADFGVQEYNACYTDITPIPEP